MSVEETSCDKKWVGFLYSKNYDLLKEAQTKSVVLGKAFIWARPRGAHLLLFFLAFVFGSFCTFCFHMLMYLFDEKCVLFPKLLSLTSLRQNIIYEFIPDEKERAELPPTALPVDFLSTQWVEKSACYLPTYVPLVSGIFGLVWTTMFLMCSSGGRSLGSGLQRSWRIIPPVFVFSIAMSCLCIYSSSVTHYGLQELCVKLGEITGSSTCSYTVNVATLAYERQIRGVYQATRLTIAAAWLHTGCWVASAFLALARILLAIDFRLVRIRVELVGDIDKMLERNEQQLRTVMPNQWIDEDNRNASFTPVASTEYFFLNQQYGETDDSINDDSGILFMSDKPIIKSEFSLLPEETHKLYRIQAYESVRKDNWFIVDIVYDLLDQLPDSSLDSYSTTSSSSEIDSGSKIIPRQYGQFTILSTEHRDKRPDSRDYIDSEEAEAISKEITEQLQKRLAALDQKKLTPSLVSLINKIKTAGKGLSLPMQLNEKKIYEKKSNLKGKPKNIGIQTKRFSKKHRVRILDSKSTFLKKLEHDRNLPSTSKKVFEKSDSEKRENILDSEEKASVEHELRKRGFEEQKKIDSEKKVTEGLYSKKEDSEKQEKKVYEIIEKTDSEEQEYTDSEKKVFTQNSEEQKKIDTEKKDFDKNNSEEQKEIDIEKNDSEVQDKTDYENKDSKKKDSG